ncbi:MAG: PIN domain-containing protein [Candidatus Peregrinibacteria bacterium]|nr:PIN domain-containing protein [Candidatus Peregrinibacteria bacterium]
MKILLDTNFILTCAKLNIDFVSRANEIIDQEIEWIVPQDVLNELGSLKDREGVKGADKKAANFSFEILQNMNPQIVELGGKNPNVDIKIVNYIIGKNIILATMDKNLKSRVDNKILTIRGKNNIELL